MELQLFSLTNLFIFFPILYILAITWKYRKSNKKLPPGPWRLPLIGNMHQLTGAPPHHILRDLAKKHGPLLFLQLGEVSNIVVSSPEMAKEVLVKNGLIFAQRPCLFSFNIMTCGRRDVANSPYGSYWRQLRKICVRELLSAKRVQSFRSIREEEMSALVNVVASNEGSPINLTKKFVAHTRGVTSKAAFGRKCKDQDAYLLCVEEFLKLSAGFSLTDTYPSMKVLPVITGTKRKFQKLFQQCDRVIQGILDEHREKMMVESNCREEDLVTTLLKVQKFEDLEFPIDDIDIKGVIWDIFIAGTVTSTTALDWAMAELIKNPKVLEKAQKEVRRVFEKKGNVDESCIHELVYLKAVIKETLRLHPSIPLSFPRESSEKCVINGFEIPAKTRVLLNAWVIGRDPEYWDEAEMFLPERFLDSSVNFSGTNMQFVPFGVGRRICPGILFGLAHIELPLAQLLYHFDWNVPNGKKNEDLDITEEFRVTTRRRDDLILVPMSYKHSLSI